MTATPITIDGSQGEGGGQILRSSLTLSLVTGRPFVMNHIRAGRKKPGLQRQHLAAVLAAAKVGQAEVEGDHLGSQRLTFKPGEAQAGEYRFKIGTAGSTTLVMQTVLPALLIGGNESQVTVEGGTHNPMAPPADFLEKAYFPVVNRLGPYLFVKSMQPGFYPAGGGSLCVHVVPCQQLGRLTLLERGPMIAQCARILLSKLPSHIAQREWQTLAQQTDLAPSSFNIIEVEKGVGPGNAVIIELEFQHVTEVFTAIGRLGVRAEDVALEAWREAAAYLASDVPVGPHLADQLMLPLGIAAHRGAGGGLFRTVDLTPHSKTHLDILQRFLDIEVHVERQGDNNVVVRIEPKVNL